MSTDHAKLSPSGRLRWGVCPASVTEEAKYPNPPSGESAIQGTHDHTLLNTIANMGWIDPAMLVGQTLKDHEGEFTVDADRASRVTVAVEYVKERLLAVPSSQVSSEQRVDPAPLVGRSDMKGTGDLFIDNFPDEDAILEVIDYKGGMAPTDAKEQMEVYGVGKLAEYQPTAFKTIRLTVIQPKLALKGMEPIKVVHEGPVSEFLERVVPALKAEGAATEEAEPKYVPGERQCKYCRAKGNCKAFNQQAVASVDLGSVADMTQAAADKDPEGMTNEEIAKLLEAAPLIRQAIEAAEAEALKRMQAGQSIPGFKVVEGRGTRAWAYDEEQMAKKLTGMGIPKGEVYQTKLVSPAQAEKLVWTKRDGSTMQLSAKQLKRMEKEYIVRKAGKPTVALDSDHRKSVVTDASSLFSSTAELPDWMK